MDLVLIDGYWSGVGPGAGWLGSDGTVLPGGASLDRLLRAPVDFTTTATLDANGQAMMRLDPGTYAVTVGDASPREITVPLRKEALIVRWVLK